MRWTALVFSPLLLAACATQPQRPPGQIDVSSTTRGQPLAGAECTVQTDTASLTLITPATIDLGEPRGDLWVVCNREGYRTSEVIIRAPGNNSTSSRTRVGVGVGGGIGRTSGVGVSLGLGLPFGSMQARYPAKVVVDLTPLNPAP